jgi:nucleotide-binding universal stress UspA family protein
MFNTIVLVTDLSPASNALVECAIGLRALGVKKVVLTYAVAAQHLHDMRHLTAAKTNPFLLEQKKKLSKQGVEVVTRRARGMSAEDIERVAEQYSASLIVIASHDESIVEHVLFKFTGAVSAVLHGFTRPLLLVKTYVVNEGMETCSEGLCTNYLANILYCTDFSAAAQHAYECVARLVEEGCKNVTIIHVQDKTKIDQDPAHSREEFDRIDAERIEILKQQLAQKGASSIQIKIAYGVPTIEILAEAKAGNYSLIVMGSQGRGYIHDMFLGSVSLSIARRAGVSVLLIPAMR